MNHIADAVFLTAALVVGGLLVVLPRPKPEPPPPVERVEQQSVQVVVAKDRVRVEPLPPQTQAERVEEVEKDLKAVADEQRELIETIKSLTEEAKKK